MKSLQEIAHTYGDGSGYGDGDETQWLSAILERYARPGLVLGFWSSNQDGTPANGGSGPPRKVGDVETIPGPLKICTKNALHATLNPDKWKGERWWIVGLHKPIQKDDDKMGSLTREIIADLGKYYL